MEFNPQKHICKFYYQRYGVLGSSKYHQNITANLYLRELQIDIVGEDGNIVKSFGYSLEHVMEEILPMLEWNK